MGNIDERSADKDVSLYNLLDDPDETKNLYGSPDHGVIIKHLEVLAEEWHREG